MKGANPGNRVHPDGHNFAYRNHRQEFHLKNGKDVSSTQSVLAEEKNMPRFKILPRLCATRVRLLPILVLTTLLAGVPGIISGQSSAGLITSVGPSVTAETAVPVPGVGHDYLHLLSETVDPSSGSVNVTVQIPLPKSRGITLPFSVTYSSAGVFHVDETAVNSLGLYSSCPPNSNTMPFGNQCGWEYGIPSVAYSYLPYSPRTGIGSCFLASQYSFTDSAHVRHNLWRLSKAWTSGGKTDCVHGTTTSPSSPPVSSSDAQVIALLDNTIAGGESITVYDTAGTVYSGFTEVSGPSPLMPQQIEDRNGNLIRATYSLSNNQYSVNFTDTSGRPSLAISGTGASGTTDNVTAGPLAIGIQWASTTASYSMPITQVGTPASVVSCPAAAASTNSAVNSTLNVVSAIHLPNGQQYTFYTGSTNPTDSTVANPYGLLNEIIYPDGGWVKYTYKQSDTYSELGLFAGTEPEGLGSQLAPNACAYEYSTPVVATRTVSYDGTSIALQQVFTYSTIFPAPGVNWSSKSTSVTATASGKSYLTQYSYKPDGIAQPVFTTSTVAEELPLEYQIKTYDWGNTTSPLQTVTKHWADQFNMTEQDTTIGGVTSKITYTPGSFLPTETDEYDFGASTPTRKTIITYQPITAPGTIVDKPCKTVVTDGVNNYETDSYYDGGTTICGSDTAGIATTPVSGLPTRTHDETSFGPALQTPRGNLTREVRVTSSGTSPATTYSYDETGQLLSITDPCGNATCPDMSGATHTTTYSYADSPAGGNNPYGQSNAYVTTRTRPSTNGVAHTESYQYNYASGELSQSTDENLKTTTYSYAEPLLRLKDVYAPASSQNSNVPHTSYNYTDNIYTPGSAHTLVNNSTVTTTGPSGITTVSVVDGLGNIIHTKLTSDPVGADNTDTTFDGLGRVQSVSNPYRSTTDLTYGMTTYNYDPLGRKRGQTQPDGTTLSWAYPNNVVIYTDANSIVSQRASDALGRLKAVLEPNASSLSANPQTTYTYNALDNLTSVTQGGALAGEQPRVRNFTYDLLGRLLTATNPETGTVCYGAWVNSACSNGYDANGNLIAKTDARGVTVTYTYDVLNRLLSKYDGSFSSCYQYDIGATNGYGRLTAEWTQPGPCASIIFDSGAVTRRSILAYDEMGRIESEQQCIVGNCTTSSVAQLWYGYDLAGEPTCLINSAGTSQTGLSLSGGARCTAGAVGTPSGLLLTTGYDAAGHINSVTSNWTAYPTNIYSMQTGGYGPVGPLSWKLGSNLSVTQDYTKRLWVNSFNATRVTQ